MSVLARRLLAAALVCAVVPAASAAYIPPDENQYWDAAFPGLESPGTLVEVVAGDGAQIYVLGEFTDIGGVAVKNVAAWDGLAWSACGVGVEGRILTAASASAGFYVGGHLSAAGGTPIRNVARWDGKRWLDLGGGVSGTVLALGVNEGCLYVGGIMREAGGAAVGRVARWDGSRWWPLGAGIIPVLVQGEEVGVISCFAFDGSNVFVGGYFRNAGGVVTRNVARWDGAQWHELGKGLRGHDRAGEYDPAAVKALQWHQGKLYAAGSFRLAGEVAATNIACWDGVQWQGVGSGVNDGV
jgi:hypothetical protein